LGKLYFARIHQPDLKFTLQWGLNHRKKAGDFQPAFFDSILSCRLEVNSQVKMTQYLRLQDQHIQEIAQKYNLKVIEYQSIENGAGNTNYCLRAKTSGYVLTLFELDHVRVVNLSRLLCWLDDHDFPTTRIQSLPTGEMITSWRGKPILLKHYIPGQVVENLGENMLLQIGTAIAKLHKIPVPDFLPVQHAYGLETFPRLLNKGINIDYEDWLAEKYAYLECNLPEMLPRSMIHGDVFYDNVLFDGSTLKAIIDFEEACYDFSLLDLGMAVVGTCTDGVDINLVKVRALLQGYHQVRTLTELEKEYLLLFIEYAAIATSSWRYWKYNVDTPIDVLAKKHWEMVNLAKNVRAMPKDSFINAVFA